MDIKQTNGILVDYYFQIDKETRFLYLKVREVKCSISQFSKLFTEIGENLIRMSFENLCIDLASMKHVTSTVFGVCVNFAGLAKKTKKRIKFRFNSDAMETARLASLDKFAEIEQGDNHIR